MTFGGEPAKKSGKMMALKLAGEKDKDGKDVVIPKFLSSDDNGNLSLFDLDKHTTDFGFLAKSLTSTTSVTAPTLNITGDNLKISSDGNDGNITSKADITSSAKIKGGQLCIGNTCIDENQLKQLVRPEVSTEKKPTDYYNLSTNSSLIYEEQQNVATIGWSTVKTIIPHTRNHRIVQQAYKIGSNDTDVSKMFTRYSLSGKDGIASDATKNGWTAWIDNYTKKEINDTFIKNNDPVDLHAGNFVLSGKNGNFDADSYATFRGQGSSDSFIIKRKNTSGRTRTNA
jgi:hypothetical protein